MFLRILIICDIHYNDITCYDLRRIHLSICHLANQVINSIRARPLNIVQQRFKRNREPIFIMELPCDIPRLGSSATLDICLRLGSFQTSKCEI